MTAKNGDTVKVHYTGKLPSGKVFDSSRKTDPFEMVLGGGQVIPGFEKNIIGMAQGDVKTFTIIAEEAYGTRQEDLVLKLDIDLLPEDITPSKGQELELKDPSGQTFRMVVMEFDDQSITLDANHPLAGKDLVFEVELVQIVE